MSTRTTHLETIRRILVALDGSSESLAALDAAALLAAHLHAQVEALFVEDADVLRLADLPCARVTSALLLQTERIDRPRLERQMRVRAMQAQEMVRRRATALRVQATFRQVRGKVATEVLAAAAEADLLSVGRTERSLAGWWPAEAALQAALAAGRPFLVVGRRAKPGQGVLMVYDGSPADGRALELAAELAESTGQGLSVLILAPTYSEARELAQRVSGPLAGRRLGLDVRYSSGEYRTAVAAALRQARPGLVVAGVESGERAGQLVQAVDCPLLLVP